jgi:hypothetical protein
VGIVGESGCGKSITAMSILKLIDPPGRIISGEVIFDGVNLIELKKMIYARLEGPVYPSYFRSQ